MDVQEYRRRMADLHRQMSGLKEAFYLGLVERYRAEGCPKVAEFAKAHGITAQSIKPYLIKAGLKKRNER